MIHSLAFRGFQRLSEAFRGLPELIKELVYYHLREELTNEADNHLSSREKKTLLGILEEMVSDFRR
jgi:hypothetical protein